MCSPLGCNRMAHTLVIPLPLKAYDNPTNMLIGNMRNPINMSGDVQLMQHKSPFLWSLHNSHDKNSDPLCLLMVQHSTTYNVQKIELISTMLNY
jgi:hypothetical protein